jgi:4-amino-4-deoxy-L-arabinose transferase-like glycosyltransferase
MKTLSRTKLHLVFLLLPALLGAALLAFATEQGPAVAGDATVYILSARNVVEGNGLGIPGPDGNFRTLSHYPPFFPIVLAGLGLVGFNFVEAARFLNIALFVVTILGLGFAFYLSTGSIIYAQVSQLLFLTSPILIYQYTWAMSEPLSLFLGFAGLLLLIAWFRKSSILFWLLSALGAGLAFLTRLIGVGFVLAGALLILLLGKGSLVKRIYAAIAYLAAGSLPMLTWSALDYLRTGSLASRDFGVLDFAGAPTAHLLHILQSLQSVFKSWLIPASWITAPPYPEIFNSLLLLAAATLFILSAAFALVRAGRQDRFNWKRDPAAMLLVSLLVFFVLYLLLAILLYITVLPRIDLNNRMLLPAHAAALGAALISGYLLVRNNHSVRWLSIPVYAVFLGVIAMYGFRSLRIVIDLNENIVGYLGREWQKSETVRAVRDLPASTVLISNEEAALLFLTGRATYPVLEFYELHPRSQMTTFGELEEDEIERKFREEEAALVLFFTMREQLSEIYGERAFMRAEILTRGLYPHFIGSDGAVFFYKNPADAGP